MQAKSNIKFRVIVWKHGMPGIAQDIPYAGLKGALTCAARKYKNEAVRLVKIQNAVTGHNVVEYDAKGV